MSADTTLTCRDCGQAFTFTSGEQDFYASRGFSEPSRCADCRAARKSQRDGRPDHPRGETPPGAGSYAARPSVALGAGNRYGRRLLPGAGGRSAAQVGGSPALAAPARLAALATAAPVQLPCWGRLRQRRRQLFPRPNPPAPGANGDARGRLTSRPMGRSRVR